MSFCHFWEMLRDRKEETVQNIFWRGGAPPPEKPSGESVIRKGGRAYIHEAKEIIIAVPG